MTEKEWLACKDSLSMMTLLYGVRSSQRKWRLFVCAYFADLGATVYQEEQATIRGFESQIDGEKIDDAAPADPMLGSFESLCNLSSLLSEGIGMPYAPLDGQKRCPLLREIFGNPFHPVTVSPTWQTATVVSLAQAIYDERAFDRMPILADALEDAGCNNQDVLNHCRQPGVHSRGCWVIAQLLGKE